MRRSLVVVGSVLGALVALPLGAGCSSDPGLPDQGATPERVGQASQRIDGICGGGAAATIDGYPAYPYCGDFDVWSNNGVDVYSSPGGGGGWVRSEAGYGFQCYELASRYMHFKWGVSTAWGVAYASEMCGSHPAGVTLTQSPVHGDLMVFPGGACGISAPAGHVAVVDSVNGSSITVVQQNSAGVGTYQAGCASCFLHADANVACTPSPEVCDGVDNDCNGQVDEGEVCEQDSLIRMPVVYAPPKTTDIDGDGRADLCGRGVAGIICALGGADARVQEQPGALLALANDQGWSDPSNYATLRMGDLDGDGRADLCARADAGIDCWTSEKTPFGTSVAGPAWGDAGGWNHTQYFSTIRLLDLDGDGKDDLCARDSQGMSCFRSTGGGFGPEIRGPAWSDANGFASAKYYGTLRTGDVNGDGKDDLCIRTAAGMECALSNGDGFDATPVMGPAWSDANGWGTLLYWSSVRLVDVNGDRRADLCARQSAGLVCHFSTGAELGPEVMVAPLSDTSGWNQPRNYETLRTGDVNGDGAADLCLRANDGMTCFVWNGFKFDSVSGPAWSNGNGWDAPQYYETIRLGDVNGDGKADLCARTAVGWDCSTSTGTGFAPEVNSPVFTDTNGWNARPYFDSILFASTCRRSPEVCNHRDDDCDGLVDEGDVCQAGDAGIDGGGHGGGDAGGTGGESDGASPSTSNGDGAGDSASASSGCSVSPTRGARAGAVAVWLGVALAVGVRRRRR